MSWDGHQYMGIDIFIFLDVRHTIVWPWHICWSTTEILAFAWILATKWEHCINNKGCKMRELLAKMDVEPVIHGDLSISNNESFGLSQNAWYPKMYGNFSGEELTWATVWFWGAMGTLFSHKGIASWFQKWWGWINTYIYTTLIIHYIR